MLLRDVWAQRVLFDVVDGVPGRLLIPMLAPPSRTLAEKAALVELAGRIGLESVGTDWPIADSLVCAASAPEAAWAGAWTGTRLVMGWDAQWLREVLGESAWAQWNQGMASAVRDDFALLDAGHLALLDHDGRTALVLTGRSPQGVLQAARHLVTDGYGLGLPATTFCTVGPPASMGMSGLSVPAASPSHLAAGLSLHNLFTDEGIYQTRTGELYPTLDVLFDLTAGVAVHARWERSVAMMELAWRLALDAGYLRFPLTACATDVAAGAPWTHRALTIRFAPQEGTSPRGSQVGEGTTDVSGGLPFEVDSRADDGWAHLHRQDDGRAMLVVGARDGEWAGWIRRLLGEAFGPVRPAVLGGWRDRLAALQHGAVDIREQAQFDLRLWEDAAAGRLQQVDIPAYFGASLAHWRSLQASGEVSVVRPVAPPAWTADWTDSGELERVEERLRIPLSDLMLHETVSPATDDAGSDSTGAQLLTVEVFTTESRQTFDHWHASMANALCAGGRRAQFVYRNANKPGLHWLLSDVMPVLTKLVGVVRVQLSARTFSPPTPHLELRQRFLQELFPADHLVATALGLPIDRIDLSLTDETGPMFSVVAYDETGEQLGEWAWDGLDDMTSVPYMPAPETLASGAAARSGSAAASVIIPHAGLRISRGTDTLLVESVETNMHRFWTWYQHEIVHQIPNRVDAQGESPKFLQLECDVWMDSDDDKLGFREEVSSALEALHEDIYFYTLYALSEHGRNVGDARWNSPGGILPLIHTRTCARPAAQVRLFTHPAQSEITVSYTDGSRQTLQALESDAFAAARATTIAVRDGQLRVHLEGLADEALAQRCQRWLVEGSAADVGLGGAGGGVIDPAKNVRRDVLQNADVADWLLRRAADIPGQVVPLERSYGGEWIWSVALHQPTAGVTSPVKHSLYKPTLWINARHHANEVSSTNAALTLIASLQAQPDILRHLNIITVPLQNVDGANIHAQMAAEHPYWKLHAARYNACGLEFMREYFQPHSRYGESRVYQAIWDQWRPDIVLDDHGIPSHEWIQPHSGYHSPPQFPMSYWVPIARMYTIWGRLEETTHPAHARAERSLRTTVVRALRDDAAIDAENQLWLDIYRRWGHQFDPRMFPLDLTDGRITYTPSITPNPSSSSVLARFTPWVTADIVSEVNDETVHGDELEACMEAHLRVHQALLQWLAKADRGVHLRRDVEPDGSIRIGIERTRPLTPREDA